MRQKNEMREIKGWLQVTRDSGIAQIAAGGNWTIPYVHLLDRQVTTLNLDHYDTIEINLSQIERMDTAGACVARQLLSMMKSSKQYNLRSNERVDSILTTIERFKTSSSPRKPKTNIIVRKIESIGKATVDAIDLAACFMEFIGKITSLLMTALFQPSRFRLGQTTSQIELSGLNAIPIIILISFLIGIVVAYQGALQLGKLGADVYTVDLLAVTLLRELGILLTAIVIAGRSGSTYAAEIGSMKINQELDAMKTIGMDPMEVLVIPRVLGLIIALPILTLIADISGIIGGGMMILVCLDMSPTLFLHHLVNAVSPWTFWVGMIKAPVFAIIIAVIGCYEGMQVSGSAESVGNHTTRAVVESIFMIIVFDALFSIFFGIIGI
jgi:phospholipid/cholesterol/gamma-HCH transport system permease protein